jgi:hypothetical protein
MIKRHPILWLSVSLVILLVASPACYYLWTRLHGEHFYRGLPTSYWSHQVKSYATDPMNWSPSWEEKALGFLFSGEPDTGMPAVLSGEAAAFPVLADLVQSAAPGVREQAIATLGSMGRSSSEGLQLRIRVVLLQAMTDETASVRYRAVGALEVARFSDDEVVSALCAALKDPEEGYAMAALPALRWTGARPEVIVTAILEAVEQQGAFFFDSAAAEMGSIPDAAPKLAEALADSHPQVRWFAARALGKNGVCGQRRHSRAEKSFTRPGRPGASGGD